MKITLEEEKAPTPLNNEIIGKVKGNTNLNQKKSRNWVFTNFEIENIDWYKDERIRNINYGLEICPTTNRLHHQGFMQLKKEQDLKWLKNQLHDKVHFDMRRGSELANIKYCSKDGKFIQSGDRSDIKKYANEILENGYCSLAEKYPEAVIRYSRGLQELQRLNDLKKSKTLRLNLKVFTITGKAGTGKTRYVYDKHGLENVFKINFNEGTIWWDGYNNEKVLLIDEFYGTIRWGLLLELLDIYPIRLGIKGSHTYAAWDTVYITSNKPYEEWYSKSDDDLAPLKRRITEAIIL